MKSISKRGGRALSNSDLFHLTKKIEAILKEKEEKNRKLQTLCKLLKDSVPHYNWVGFYFVDKKRRNELVLGPFEGEPTEHVRIPFGKGICGQAAERRETFMVEDVSKETNYLSCSANVKSEIVVPIFKNREVVGELDIDSHRVSSFTKEDEAFLNMVCEMISRIL
jgi:L-methionine (R)-S-oxide reductase